MTIRSQAVAAIFLCCCAAVGLIAQDTPSAKPAEHILGTITAVDTAAQTVTVKEDASGAEHAVALQSTRTLLKVSPGAKDLKGATRITPADLVEGDRVDIRGTKDEGGAAIVAKSLVLMSSRELQQAKQQEASAWQRSSAGPVTAIDAPGKKLTVTVRTAEGPKASSVDAAAASFSRYAPEHPKTANSSQFSDIQVGDQVRIIGEKSPDGATIAAQKIYSGSFKTIAATVVSVGGDGQSLVVKDLGSKQPVKVALNQEAGIHKLPPMMAAMLARRFNPDAKTAQEANGAGWTGGSSPAAGMNGQASGARPDGAAPGGSGMNRPGGGGGNAPGGPGSNGPGSPVNNGPGGPGGPGGMRGGRMANGDLSQMLDRLPKIAVTDLKAGDAVVVSGSPAQDKTTLLANSVIAGVEPIFQAAPGRQAQSLGDWGNSLNAGAGLEGSGPPQ